MKKQKRYYYCKHCNKRFDTFYMADTCFQLDMKLLQTKQNENDKNNNAISGSSKQSGNK